MTQQNSSCCSASRFLLQQRLQAQQGTKAEQPVQLLLAEPLMGWAATLAHGLPPLLLLHCGAAPLVPESPERLQLLAVLSMAEAAWPPRRWWGCRWQAPGPPQRLDRGHARPLRMVPRSGCTTAPLKLAKRLCQEEAGEGAAALCRPVTGCCSLPAAVALYGRCVALAAVNGSLVESQGQAAGKPSSAAAAAPKAVTKAMGKLHAQLADLLSASEHLGVRTGVRICRGFRRKIRSCFPYNRRCDFHGVRGRFPRNPHLKKTAVRPMDSVDFASRMSAESVGASAPLMWRIRTSNVAHPHL